MTGIQSIRTRGQLSPLDCLLAAQAKLSQAEAILKSAGAVHGPTHRLDRLALQALRSHIGLALQGIHDIRKERQPARVSPCGFPTPILSISGRIVLAESCYSAEVTPWIR